MGGGEEAAPPPATAGEGRALTIEVNMCGKTLTVTKRNLEDDDFTDPCFFDEDYSPAAATGFVVWEGTWMCIRLLREGELQSELVGRRVVELGAGIGLAGLAAAAAGAHVLQTDLPSVVDGTIRPNIARNADAAAAAAADTGPASDAGDLWTGAQRVGRGSIVPMALDWCKPLDAQCVAAGRANDPRDADVILAVETVWLTDLIQPFVATAVSLMHGPKRPQCWFLNGERATAASKTFATMAAVMEGFAAAGCEWEQVLEAPSDEPGKPTKLFRVWLPPAAAAAARC